MDGDGVRPPDCDSEGILRHRGRQRRSRRGHGDAGLIRQFEGGVNLFAVRQEPCTGHLDVGEPSNGIQLFNASQSLVRDSSGNGPNEEIGLGLFSSNHVRIVHNSFGDTALDGIVVSGGAHNLVDRNKIRGAGKNSEVMEDGVAVDSEPSTPSSDATRRATQRTTVSTSKALPRSDPKPRRGNRDLGIEAVRGVTTAAGTGPRATGTRASARTSFVD